MKLLFTKCLTLLTFIVSPVIWSLRFYDTGDNSAHGIRFVLNDKFMLMAFNSFLRMEYRLPPYQESTRCQIGYHSPNFFVYSVVAMSQNASNSTMSSENFHFMVVGEDTKDQRIIILRFTIRGSCKDGTGTYKAFFSKSVGF